jgi:hypothetical protein
MLRTLLSPVALASLLILPAGAQQATPAELFDRGESWEAFLAGVEARGDQWRTNVSRAAPPAAIVERLRAAGADLTLLAIAVDACSDSVSTLPYVAKVAEAAGVELRIVNPTAGRHLMEAHPTPDGRAATPTIILLRGREVAGVFVERPKALQDWYLSEAGQALTDRERVSRKMSWYDWDRGDSTVAEIVALAEGDGSVFHSSGQSGARPRPGTGWRPGT